MRHVYGWLLLTPAAILLIAFTYWPIGATVADSLFSRGNPVRPAQFIGLENYALMAEDPIFWQVLWNNALFALGTIPASIALALMLAFLLFQRQFVQSFMRAGIR